jgi:hypothetical protein
MPGVAGVVRHRNTERNAMLHVLTAMAIAAGAFGVMTCSALVLQAERRSEAIRDRILEHVNHDS